MEKESHLLELARYIVLNPVWAKIVHHPRQYRWSSYRTTVGEAKSPRFLTVDWILTQFDQDLVHGRAAYRQFVKEGRGVPVWDDVKGGFLLGTEEFVGRMKPLLRGEEADSEISNRQCFADCRSLEHLFGGVVGDRHMRNERIHEAVMEHGAMALQKYLGLHPSTLSRIVNTSGRKRMQETMLDPSTLPGAIYSICRKHHVTLAFLKDSPNRMMIRSVHRSVLVSQRDNQSSS